MYRLKVQMQQSGNGIQTLSEARHAQLHDPLREEGSRTCMSSCVLLIGSVARKCRSCYGAHSTAVGVETGLTPVNEYLQTIENILAVVP